VRGQGGRGVALGGALWPTEEEERGKELGGGPNGTQLREGGEGPSDAPRGTMEGRGAGRRQDPATAAPGQAFWVHDRGFTWVAVWRPWADCLG
jgi:hypothetical protein